MKGSVQKRFFGNSCCCVHVNIFICDKEEYPMEKLYTSERNTQILISLMKFHGVKKVVASPGTTNLCLVGSLQHDPFLRFTRLLMKDLQRILPVASHGRAVNL